LSKDKVKDNEKIMLEDMEMNMNNQTYNCPICNSADLMLRHEASYVYSYVLDSDAPGRNNSEEFLSYLYDKREQKDSTDYIVCNKCGTKYPYNFIHGILNQDTFS
jgi:transcription elongation factor Elf1